MGLLSGLKKQIAVIQANNAGQAIQAGKSPAEVAAERGLPAETKGWKWVFDASGNPIRYNIPAQSKSFGSVVGKTISSGVKAAVSVGKAIALTPTIAAVSLVDKKAAEKLNDKLDVLGDKELVYANAAAKAGAVIAGGAVISGLATAAGAGAAADQVKKGLDTAKEIDKKVDDAKAEIKIAMPKPPPAIMRPAPPDVVSELFKGPSDAIQVPMRAQYSQLAPGQAGPARELDWLEQILKGLADILKGN